MFLRRAMEYNGPDITGLPNSEKAMSPLKMRRQLCRPLTLRWCVVIAGLLGQLIVGILVGLSYRQPGTPTFTLARHAGSCRVASIRPFTEAWLMGLRVGDRVQVNGVQGNCLALGVGVRVQAWIPLADPVANATPPAVNRLSLVLAAVALLLI